MSSHNVAASSYAHVCAAEEIARLKARLAMLEPVAEREEARKRHAEARQHVLGVITLIMGVILDACKAEDIPVPSWEVFGSVVYWLKCQTSPGWDPDDLDIRLGCTYISRFDRVLNAWQRFSKGSHLELEDWENKSGSYRYGRSLVVRRLHLVIREKGVEEKVSMDILLSHQLPPAESTLTAWSIMRHANGVWLLNDRTKQPTSTFTEFGGEAFGLNEPNHEVKWLAPKPSSFKNTQYLVGRLAKLYRKVRWVADHPFRVVEIDRECAVCRSEQSKHIVHKCGHTNCLECTSRLQRPTCPECRKDISVFLSHGEALPYFYVASLKDTGVASAPAL